MTKRRKTDPKKRPPLKRSSFADVREAINKAHERLIGKISTRPPKV